MRVTCQLGRGSEDQNHSLGFWHLIFKPQHPHLQNGADRTCLHVGVVRMNIGPWPTAPALTTSSLRPSMISVALPGFFSAPH